MPDERTHRDILLAHSVSEWTLRVREERRFVLDQLSVEKNPDRPGQLWVVESGNG